MKFVGGGVEVGQLFFEKENALDINTCLQIIIILTMLFQSNFLNKALQKMKTPQQVEGRYQLIPRVFCS